MPVVVVVFFCFESFLGVKVENEGNTVFVSVCLFVIILVGVVLFVCSFFFCFSPLKSSP